MIAELAGNKCIVKTAFGSDDGLIMWITPFIQDNKKVCYGEYIDDLLLKFPFNFYGVVIEELLNKIAQSFLFFN